MRFVAMALCCSACVGEMTGLPHDGVGGGGGGGSVAAMDSGTAGGSAGGAAGGAAGGSAGGGVEPMPGPPGCGFSAAAFCETFDAPVQSTGRARELDVKRFSLARLYGQLGTAMPIRSATVSDCRANVASPVLPPNDTLVCDPSAGVASRHLMMAAAEQNYGTHSLRIRQPFDFAGRTGRIVLDVDGTSSNDLVGWVGVSVTEDPMASPSFSMIPGAGNSEGGVIPRNGVELHLMTCPYAQLPSTRVNNIHEFRNYEDHIHVRADQGPCVRTQRDRLNRLEVRLSQTRVELWATPFSADGVTFGAPVMLGGADLSLNFTRGYVHLTTYNHASMKYTNDTVDAWVTRWDNVGFDGPVIADTAEYEAGDAMVSSPAGVEVGWIVRLSSHMQKTAVTVRGVDVTGAKSARLGFNMAYLQNAFGDADFTQYAIQYRLNGGAPHVEPLSAGEKALLQSGITLRGEMEGQQNPVMWGALGQVVSVPVSELRSGDNTVEIAIVGMPDHYPGTLSNVDLVLQK